MLDFESAQDEELHSVRDRLWLWGHEAGAHNGEWGIPGKSRMTPVEAAFYMSLSNLIMVRYRGKPEPPYDQYALAFRPLKRVVWSIIGAFGATESEDRSNVRDLAMRTPNIRGVIMDDLFLTQSADPDKATKIAVLSVEELGDLQKSLKSPDKKLDLWVVLYDRELQDPVGRHLKLCDVITFWTSKAADLANAEANFEKVEKLAPSARKLLGCYMWDYGDQKPISVDAMERQTRLGLQLLEQKRIHGMVFVVSCICDLGLEAVEWTRDWIQEVGARKI